MRWKSDKSTSMKIPVKTSKNFQKKRQDREAQAEEAETSEELKESEWR